MPRCAGCEGEIPAGVRWCPLCRVFTVRTTVGVLARPVDRLRAQVWDLLVALGFPLSLALQIPHLRAGSTFGKSRCGLRIVGEDGRPASTGTVIFREFVGKPVSAVLW